MGKSKEFLDSNFNEQATEFFRAVQRNQLNEVKQILKVFKESESFGPDTDTRNNVVNTLRMPKSGDTALHVSACQGHLHIIRYLVEEENANLEQINHDGKTALHDAAQFSQLDILKYLLSKGANVNVVKRGDWTPLMLACTKPNLQVVVELVNGGANLFFVNKDGWTCLHIAAREGTTDIISYLVECYNKIDCHLQEPFINRRSRNGRKPLHTAVMHGHLDTVKILTRGSSQQMLNEEDNCGSTPLMDACRFGFPDIAQFLIDECSVNPSSVNKNGVGLLHVSAEADQSEMIRVLVEKYKLDLNLQSHLLSFTPLHWAAREGNISAVRTLISLGANLTCKDLQGRTAADLSHQFEKNEIYCLLRKED